MAPPAPEEQTKRRLRRPSPRLIVAAATGVVVVGVVVVGVVVVPGREATRAAGRATGTAASGLVPQVASPNRSASGGHQPAQSQESIPGEQAAAEARAWARLPTTGWIATLRQATTWSTRPGGAVAGHLAARNPYGTHMVVALVGAPRADGWADVELPVRPNGSTGWIRWRGTRLDRTSYRVHVDLDSRSLTVLEGTRTVLTTRVAVGTPRTPTPTGSTYLWELVRPDDPAGAYGPYVFGLALYSDAYAVFNGGEAQIGIHGSDEPGSIGEAASNGCVRLPNAVVSHLTGVLPLGTPVTISA